jgi:hypothetical protein
MERLKRQGSVKIEKMRAKTTRKPGSKEVMEG